MANPDIPTLSNQLSSTNNPPPKHHHHSCSDGDVLSVVGRHFTINKENNHANTSSFDNNDKENSVPFGRNLNSISNSNSNSLSSSTNGSLVMQQRKKSLSTGRALKSSSLQMYSEAAPASSWSALPNRPLPLDVRRSTCLIVKEASPDSLVGGTVNSLYTNEGHRKQDWKLAIAHHRRHGGRSEFIIAQKLKGLVCCSDEIFVGNVTANLLGSKYHIWNQNQVQENGKQIVLQLGRIGKSKFVMDFM
ncbi:unnamed protein product [Linum tenue]|uniref:Tubby C-terminal domain-containing protein n=1 Tax=Linum tenue TaxID=586396 RepID=A0AAV0IT72_9ROSI|nr:unnamed protein product [Linum tenue]